MLFENFEETEVDSFRQVVARLAAFWLPVLRFNLLNTIFWKIEFELENLCGASYWNFKNLMPKMKKIYFPIFTYYKSFFWFDFYFEILCGAMQCYWKVLCKKWKKIFPWNSKSCKLILHMRPETCVTHRYHQLRNGLRIIFFFTTTISRVK